MHEELKTNEHPIRRARLAKGWTIEQLAAVVNLPSRTILLYEDGAYRPSRVVLGMIGKALDEVLDGNPSREIARMHR